ncbi:alpha/beta hydrolase [Flavobacterium sp. MXW15]|uniref:Alpha/beta hydrolase n=1 Tax=Xanthomonas chitinilytica TaxID=2989819 RepID=A0ABT3JSH7_9XANT|nr:alpha/beta hydrolase [Xanthomonas sp. H13-6]MCW4454210.1 alpha/beta hydrolase [Flavobacterium sp. MXW15]MCW4471444.1 alpha/beta hydrolase [Xanthomonas sp. H13-6]
MRRDMQWIMAMLFGFAVLSASAQESAAPAIERIEGGDGQPMAVHVFAPPQPAKAPRAAIVLFHGGGWTVGEASWIHGTARLLAEAGMVAVSVEYRLSNRDDVTPFDAVADARAAIRWVRREATRLGVDPGRVAAGGISAGGHLAAATAVFDEPSADAVPARPDALVLSSAAVAVAGDGWFRRLAGGAAQAAALSPDRYVRHGMPPTILLQGEEDSVTPAAGARDFCDSLRRVGTTCELHLYPGVGHLFTRNLAQQEEPDYSALDADIRAQGNAAVVAFLRGLGFAGD